MLSKPKHQDQSDVNRTYPFFLAFMALVCQLDVRENILGKKLENMSWIRPVKFESRCMIFCYQLGLTISVFSVLQRIHWFLLTSRYFLIENVKFVPSFYHISPDIPACFVTFSIFHFQQTNLENDVTKTHATPDLLINLHYFCCGGHWTRDHAGKQIS